jgi:hypothetical protein
LPNGIRPPAEGTGRDVQRRSRRGDRFAILAIQPFLPYIDRMTYRTLSILLAAVATAVVPTVTSAKEKVKPTQQALPGVDAGYSIVKPVPEPPESAVAENGDRFFKVGNTEVRIGGYLRVDIGTGSSSLRSRR